MTKTKYWREFSRRKDLEDAIRAFVNAQPDNTPFQSQLISDLVAERHYFCNIHQLRPRAFKKTLEDYPYRFYGLFDRHGWHPVSWTKSIAPPPTKRDIITAALRERTKEVKTKFRLAHPVCMHCHSAPSEETHHAAPTFGEIVQTVFSRVSAADIDSALASWDWFRIEQFAAPEGHVITNLFDEIHATARLEALCAKCHDATEGLRRASTKVARP